MEEDMNAGGMEQPDSFPERLRHAIGNRSAREIALDAKLSPTVVHQYLSGKSEPTRKALIALANATGVTLNWLATGFGSKLEGKSLSDEDLFKRIACYLYAGGYDIEEIGALFSISEDEIRQWKSSTRKYGDKSDEWDNFNAQRNSTTNRLKNLLNRQVEYLEKLSPSEITVDKLESLARMRAVIDDWDKPLSEQNITKNLAEIATANQDRIDEILSQTLIDLKTNRPTEQRDELFKILKERLNVLSPEKIIEAVDEYLLICQVKNAEDAKLLLSTLDNVIYNLPGYKNLQAKAYYLKGDIYEEINKTKSSIDSYRKAKSIDPNVLTLTGQFIKKSPSK